MFSRSHFVVTPRALAPDRTFPAIGLGLAAMCWRRPKPPDARPSSLIADSVYRVGVGRHHLDVMNITDRTSHVREPGGVNARRSAREGRVPRGTPDPHGVFRGGPRGAEEPPAPRVFTACSG